MTYKRIPADMANVLDGVSLYCPKVVSPNLHPDDADFLKTIGLPRNFNGWFDEVESVVTESEDWRGVRFKCHTEDRICGSVAVLVRQRFFPLVIEITTRAILFVKDDGNADFVNSGLCQFLFCVGSFTQSSKRAFGDAQKWLAKCEEFDPAAFRDENGAWPVLFDEAIHGLF